MTYPCYEPQHAKLGIYQEQLQVHHMTLFVYISSTELRMRDANRLSEHIAMLERIAVQMRSILEDMQPENAVIRGPWEMDQGLVEVENSQVQQSAVLYVVQDDCGEL